jgi:hypothetical protein
LRKKPVIHKSIKNEKGHFGESYSPFVESKRKRFKRLSVKLLHHHWPLAIGHWLDPVSFKKPMKSVFTYLKCPKSAKRAMMASKTI